MEPTSSATGPIVDTTQREAPALAELFTPGQILWLSFLGSPLSGAVLCALNLRALGRRGSVPLIASALALFAASFAADMFVEDLGTIVILIGQPVMIVFLGWFAHREFSGSLRLTNRRGTHVAIGVSVLSIGGLLAGWLVASIVLSIAGAVNINEEPDGVSYGKSEWVYFDGGASRRDAERVKSVLVLSKIFNGANETSLTIRRNRYLTVAASYPRTAFDDGGARAWAQWFAPILATSLDPPECVTLQLFEIESDSMRDEVESCPPGP